VSPEAASGGPIAAVQTGDIIDIDLEARTLHVRLSDEEIQKRIASLPKFEPRSKSKWLRRYAHFVTSANTGAILKS
jgi:dihydroxy-acid dehydratase